MHRKTFIKGSSQISRLTNVILSIIGVTITDVKGRLVITSASISETAARCAASFNLTHVEASHRDAARFFDATAVWGRSRNVARRISRVSATSSTLDGSGCREGDSSSFIAIRPNEIRDV